MTTHLCHLPILFLIFLSHIHMFLLHIPLLIFLHLSKLFLTHQIMHPPVMHHLLLSNNLNFTDLIAQGSNQICINCDLSSIKYLLSFILSHMIDYPLHTILLLCPYHLKPNQNPTLKHINITIGIKQ